MKSILVVFLAFGLGLAAPKKKAATALDNSDLIPIPDHLLEDYHQPSGIIDNLKLDFMFDQPLLYLSILKKGKPTYIDHFYFLALLHTIRKVKFLSKSSFFTKPQVFHPNFFG